MTEEELKGYLVLFGLKEIHEIKRYRWIMSKDDIDVVAHRKGKDYEVSLAGMIVKRSTNAYEIFQAMQELMRI